MVSSGCPAIMPEVFAITDATNELKSDFYVGERVSCDWKVLFGLGIEGKLVLMRYGELTSFDLNSIFIYN